MRIFAILGWALLLLMSACQTVSERPDAPPRRIGVSFVDIDEPTELIQRGVLQSARPRMERVRWNSAGNSPAKQRGDLDEFFAEPVEVLILQPADADVLAYAQSKAAAKGIPLTWIREPRIGPVDPLPDLSRVETDWAAAFRPIPGTAPDQVIATRPIEREGLLLAIRGACAADPAGCPGVAAVGSAPGGSGPRLALDDEALRRLIPPTAKPDASGRPWAIAGEDCARGLYSGEVGGCLDTRPFEIGRAALGLAEQALAECDALTPAPSQGERENEGILSQRERGQAEALSRGELAEIGTSFPPNGCGLAAARRVPGASPPSVGGPRSAIGIVPRWVPPAEAAALTYRWPDLLLRSGAGADRVVGDGLH